MKKISLTLLIVLSLSFGISGFSNSSFAKESNTQEYNSAKKDVFLIVRIVENGKRYICIYIGDIFISKMEEL